MTTHDSYQGCVTRKEDREHPQLPDASGDQLRILAACEITWVSQPAYIRLGCQMIQTIIQDDDGRVGHDEGESGLQILVIGERSRCLQFRVDSCKQFRLLLHVPVIKNFGSYIQV